MSSIKIINKEEKSETKAEEMEATCHDIFCVFSSENEIIIIFRHIQKQNREGKSLIIHVTNSKVSTFYILKSE